MSEKVHGQNNNTSRNRMVEFRGVAMSISDAIRKSGSPIAYGAIMRRLGLGWDLEKALTKRSQKKPQHLSEAL